MRSFHHAVCAWALLLSALVAAEQPPKPMGEDAKPNGCHGMLITVWNGQPGQTFCADRPKPQKQTPANSVVIYNGNQKQTRIFNASTDPSAPVQNLPPAVIAIVTAESTRQPVRPVVVGITSSASGVQPVVVNIASSGSSAQPVVVGIASSGFQTAGTVEPVAIGVSPRPLKRQPYRPAYLDRQ